MTGKYWKKICAIPAYMFLLSPSGTRVQKMEGGNWIDQHEAQKVVDEAEEELSELRKDAERLNWLDGRVKPVIENQNWGQPEGELAGYDWGVFGQCGSVREAIDDAMSKEASHG